MAKKRYAQVGLGSRSIMYSRAVTELFADHAELVGLCDSNEGRLRLRADWARERGVEASIYSDDQFERMIVETKPDVVIVATTDATHDGYICRAMELGCDVMTEKPMTTDEHKCQRIIDTQRETGRQCKVTFNYRYSPPRTQVKALLMAGVIGDVVSVDFHWLLDTRHGADYFRRWHRNKRNSGGLMVHKATHHFDLVNWWLSTVPEVVYASGTRNFYRPETAERYGLTERGARCLGCPEAEKCPFYMDMRAFDGLRRMYLENEQYDGYYRDKCVFGAEADQDPADLDPVDQDLIDIEDTMAVTVTYRSGARMSYSLHAFMPSEGYAVAFNGSKGRLEHVCMESAYISGDDSIPGELRPEGTKIRIFPHFHSGYEVEIWQGEGGHGGADPVMLEHLFLPDAPEDTYLRAADQRAGAWSILTGVAANRSMEREQSVRIDELIHDLEESDYPPMPSPTESLELPGEVDALPPWLKR